MKTIDDIAVRPVRSNRLKWFMALVLLGSLFAWEPVRAGPIQLRQQRIAARRVAHQALLQRRADRIGTSAVQARSGGLNRQAILQSALMRRQERFYARALGNRMVRVPRPQGLRFLMVRDATGALPGSPIIDYLLWRRSLNPARFDFYHPRLGPMLAQNPIPCPVPSPCYIPPTCPPPEPGGPIGPEGPTGPGGPYIPPTTDPGGPISGGGTDPRGQVPIPEPGSMTLWAALAIGGGYAWMRRRQTQARIEHG